MKLNLLFALTLAFPVLAGLLAGVLPCFRRHRTACRVFTGIALVLTSAGMIFSAIRCRGEELVLWQLTRDIPVLLKMDDLSFVFTLLVAVMWPLAGLYSFEYMDHEKEEYRFDAFYLVTMGVLSALTQAGNLVTFYMFYEAMTLMTLPLVLHTRTKEAIAAGIKYLVYSVFGASAALLGIFFINRYCNGLGFAIGGTVNAEAIAGHETVLLVIALVMIMGFGTKAGMFPLHGWLPTAHPAAPAPASAVLSGVITKMGVLGVIRVVFYVIGAERIRGTWVQTVWMILALITVFMGSMMALKEDTFKKRLAYSSVSQVSYILFGLSTLTVEGMTGSLLHVCFHSAIKITLFMTAGVIICKTGITEVSNMKGIGKRMPVILTLFTVVSLGLIGIPPTGGFVSKWYLASGAMMLDNAVSLIGPAVLLISAILTAAYLLTVSIRGFFPGKELETAGESVKTTVLMWGPMLLLTLFVLFAGMFPDTMITFFRTIAESVM